MDHSSKGSHIGQIDLYNWLEDEVRRDIEIRIIPRQVY